MTRKLYYEDSHIREFQATVTACLKAGRGYHIALDQTAFFPGGGGQDPDTGTIGPAHVTGAYEKDGIIYHETDRPLEAGETYACTLDWEQRFRRMQNHSGEHIVSGIVHRRFGLNNVGFHMGLDCMTVDYDGELTREQLDQVETEANRMVAANAVFRTEFPSPEALASMEYRAKLDLTENVRIVTVDGCDRCACCAPHVKLAGEIGVIKILDFMRHRGGVRLSMLCGLDALEDYREKYANVYAISGLLSVTQKDVARGVSRLLEEKEALEAEVVWLRRELARVKAETLKPSKGNSVIFEPMLDGDSQRELVNAGMAITEGVFACFVGNDREGYRFVAGSLNEDLTAFAARMRTELGAKGGGSPRMIQGQTEKARAEIEAFFQKK